MTGHADFAESTETQTMKCRECGKRCRNLEEQKLHANFNEGHSVFVPCERERQRGTNGQGVFERWSTTCVKTRRLPLKKKSSSKDDDVMIIDDDDDDDDDDEKVEPEVSKEMVEKLKELDLRTIDAGAAFISATQSDSVESSACNGSPNTKTTKEWTNNCSFRRRKPRQR